MKIKSLKKATLEDYSKYNERVNDLLFEIESFEEVMVENKIQDKIIVNTIAVLNRYFRTLLDIQAAWDGTVETANEYIDEFYKVYRKMDFKVMKEEDITELNKDLLELINNVNEYKVPSLSDFVKTANTLLEGKDENK